MIEPAYAARLGFSEPLPLDDNAADNATRHMQALGISRIRIILPERVHGSPDPAPPLAFSKTSVLLSVSADTHDAPAIALLLPAWDATTESIEVCWNGVADHDKLRQMAGAVRAAGKTAVLGLPADDAARHISVLGEAGILGAFDVIGLHHVGAAHEPGADWAARIEAVRAARPELRVWITAAGYSTWRHDDARQTEAFLDALHAPAEQVYWHSLTDADPAALGPAAAKVGITDRAGAPKLLARLLAGGIANVEQTLALARRMPAPAIVGTRPVVITGGAGFIGANLADRLAADGHTVVVYDALSRAGVERNLRWLARRHPARISVALADVRDETALADCVRGADAVFHLAGQVAVTTSMDQPVTDFDINARGTLAVLEALRRHNPAAPLVFASTNKVYGDLADIGLTVDGDCYLPAHHELRAGGVDETRPLCFHTPYGCSKGAADQYVLDYARSFGLRTAVLRMSCIYGERQLGTEDQGWVAHFLLKAIAGEPITIYGDGRQVRDVLHVGDAVAAYVGAWRHIGDIAGRAFNLGGGPANAISLLQLIAHIESLLGSSVDLAFSAWRPGDQRYFVADAAAARRALGLAPPLGWRVGVARLAEHFGARTGAAIHSAGAAL
jgi:CDP-paratose 2-epimerase